MKKQRLKNLIITLFALGLLLTLFVFSWMPSKSLLTTSIEGTIKTIVEQTPSLPPRPIPINIPIPQPLISNCPNFGRLVMKRFFEGGKWTKDGYDLQKWVDHCHRFHIVQIEPNKTTEIKVTYIKKD